MQIALRLRAFGGPENFELTDVPKPAIRPGMALIRVDATSVNQIDVRIRSGQVPIGPDPPTILGADVAGTIEEVGAGVLDFAPRRRSLWLRRRTPRIADHPSTATQRRPSGFHQELSPATSTGAFSTQWRGPHHP